MGYETVISTRAEIDLSGKRTGDKTIGYSAYIETLNGFSKALYQPVDRMADFAKRISKSFGSSSSPWTTSFDEMATKTILKNLLSRYGIMTVEMQTAFVADIGTVADEQTKDVPDERLKDASDVEVSNEVVPLAEIT